MEIYYFLKCERCGFLTEIKHENHNYCYNCTQRFNNYFKLWNTKNKSKNLNDYKESICIKVSKESLGDTRAKNAKLAINNPTSDQVKRRTYIKKGIPLDRGGHTEWDWDSIKRRYLVLAIIAVILVVLILLTENGKI